MKSDTFYGDFMVKLFWRLIAGGGGGGGGHGENMVNQITRQSPH